MDIPIKQTAVYFAETEDLNHLLVNEFKSDAILEDEDDYHYAAIQSENENDERMESQPISIENVETFLALIKSKGGTHVAFDFHGDHNTYLIEGYKMEKR